MNIKDHNIISDQPKHWDASHTRTLVFKRTEFMNSTLTILIMDLMPKWSYSNGKPKMNSSIYLLYIFYHLYRPADNFGRTCLYYMRYVNKSNKKKHKKNNMINWMVQSCYYIKKYKIQIQINIKSNKTQCNSTQCHGLVCLMLSGCVLAPVLILSHPAILGDIFMGDPKVTLGRLKRARQARCLTPRQMGLSHLCISNHR